MCSKFPVTSPRVTESEVKVKAAQLHLTLQPCGLYSPWNSPGQNTGVVAFSSPGDLPNPGIKPRSPA